MSEREYEERHRYRIYRIRGGEQQEVASTSTKEGVGVALVTLREEGEWGVQDPIGVLDTKPWSRGRGAFWIVNPYARGR